MLLGSLPGVNEIKKTLFHPNLTGLEFIAQRLIQLFCKGGGESCKESLSGFL